MTIKKEVPDILQKNTIYVLLAAHCQKGENGFAIYEDGWSDRLIADKANMRGTTSVANVRRAVYGHLEEPKNITLQDVIERLVKLENNFRELASQLGKVT